jgi:hypothetical protein
LLICQEIISGLGSLESTTQSELRTWISYNFWTIIRGPDGIFSLSKKPKAKNLMTWPPLSLQLSGYILYWEK